MPEFTIDHDMNPGNGLLCKDGLYKPYGLFYKPLTYIFSNKYHGITLFIHSLPYCPTDREFIYFPKYIIDISYYPYDTFDERLKNSVLKMRHILTTIGDDQQRDINPQQSSSDKHNLRERYKDNILHKLKEPIGD